MQSVKAAIIVVDYNPEEGDSLDGLFIEALDRGDAEKAAAILREADGLGKHTCEALADMLDGNPDKKQIPPVHLSSSSGAQEMAGQNKTAQKRP